MTNLDYLLLTISATLAVLIVKLAKSHVILYYCHIYNLLKPLRRGFSKNKIVTMTNGWILDGVNTIVLEPLIN